MVKVFAEQVDINLEYCDREGADKDCVLMKIATCCLVEDPYVM